MRTVYLGTSDFAVAVLHRLAASDHRPVLVVTRPDRPRGRGRRLSAPPAAEAARELGIKLDQPENVNSEDARQRIAAASPDRVLICAFGALIAEPLLSAYPMLNVHPSLLPRWRGAAPIERAIEVGDRQTGVSIMRPTAELDAGPVCLQRAVQLREREGFAALSARLAALGGEMLVEALAGTPQFVDQDQSGATYADKVTAEDRCLDPARSAIELDRRIRALTPHVGAWVEVPGVRRLTVVSATPVCSHAEPGSLAEVDGRLLLGCAEGSLVLEEVRPAGRRTMTGVEFLRGHRHATGPALGSQ